jgi:hypothetical protein
MSKTCSLGQWLSVYHDGEMDSPYKEKMESHIASCADCQRQTEAYKKISLSFESAQDGREEEARLRVLQKLETRGIYAGFSNRVILTSPIWKRRVSIPVPAAAAAVVFMIIALAFLWVIRSPGKTGTENMMAINAAETEIFPDMFPVSGMENVLQYLGGNDTGEIIILRLPESRRFSSYGEPSIIKAADYQRTEPGRRKQ